MQAGCDGKRSICEPKFFDSFIGRATGGLDDGELFLIEGAEVEARRKRNARVTVDL